MIIIIFVHHHTILITSFLISFHIFMWKAHFSFLSCVKTDEKFWRFFCFCFCFCFSFCFCFCFFLLFYLILNSYLFYDYLMFILWLFYVYFMFILRLFYDYFMIIWCLFDIYLVFIYSRKKHRPIGLLLILPRKRLSIWWQQIFSTTVT